MRANFAPISSGESGYADLAALYFMGSGILRALLTLTLVVLAVVLQSNAHSHLRARAEPLVFLAIGVGFSVATGEFFAGRLISRRRRVGAMLAAVVMGFPIIADLVIGRTPSVSSVVWVLISAAVLTTIWRELR